MRALLLVAALLAMAGTAAADIHVLSDRVCVDAGNGTSCVQGVGNDLHARCEVDLAAPTQATCNAVL